MAAAFHDDDSKHDKKYFTLKNGREVFVRPIEQTDDELLLALFQRLGPDSIYMRFLSPLRTLSDDLLFKLTHINYKSDFALVALINENGSDSIIAVARYGYDPSEKATDFAVLVRDDWQNLGLGKFLLAKILTIGRQQGITRFVSIIDSTNRIMKHIIKNLGYSVKYSYKAGHTKIHIFV